MTSGIYKSRRLINICFIILLFLHPKKALAQSDNYWSWNFNTPSMLMAGSVVGGSTGPSAIFYNPSTINHESVPSLSISANILSFQSFYAENIVGEGIDVDKTILKIQPRFLSYVFPSKNKKVSMVIAIITPVSDEIRYSVEHFDELDIIERTAGEEVYSGQVKYHRKYEDYYAGWGISYEVSENFYLGASTFASIKVLAYDFINSAQAHQREDTVIVDQTAEARYTALNSFNESLTYFDISLVLKLGAFYKMLEDRFSIGMNITLPNIPIYGEADVAKSLNRSNVYDNSQNIFTSNDLFMEAALGTRARVKTPFSVALGMQYSSKNDKNTASITAEYFNGIDSYAIIDPQVDVYSLPSEWKGIIDIDDAMSYYTQANPVVNLGVGFNRFISPTLSLLGGFRTDFASQNNNDYRFTDGKFKINQLYVNKYYFTIGPMARIKNFYFVSGLQYSFGRNYDVTQIKNYSHPVEYNPESKQSLEGARENTAFIRFRELSFFLGLTVDFK